MRNPRVKHCKLPKFVRITNRVRYRVRLVDCVDDDPESDGLCHFEIKTIFLRKKLKGRKLQEALWHEIGHAMVRENKVKVDEDLEEYIMKKVERPLARVIRLNNLRFQ